MPSSTNSKLWIAGIGRTKHYIQNFLKTTGKKANNSSNYSSVKTASLNNEKLWKIHYLGRAHKKAIRREQKGNGAEMRHEIVSGIVTGDALVSHWPTLSLSPVTVPEVFAKVNSAPGTCFSKSPETFRARRQI